MGLRHLAFVVTALACLVSPAMRANALELGELRAVSGRSPPYVFRLSIISSQYGLPEIPAVTVRQPPNVLSMVKHNFLELRLPALVDVELEITQGGQTLNRFLLKSEFQAARAGLETAATTVRQLPAPVKERQAQLQETKPPTSTAAPPTPQYLLEHDLQELRQAMHTLVARVTPWAALSTPVWHEEGRAATPVFTLTLGEGVSIGLAVVFIGYMIRCQMLDRRQRHMIEASIRRLRVQLTSGEPNRQSSQRVQLSEFQPEALPLVSVKRRVRVSQKTRRRIRVRTSRDPYEVIQAGTVDLTQPKPLAPAEVVEVLGHLRRELNNLQRRLPHMSSSESSAAESPPAAR
jgi:hypothetical protein